MDYNIKPICKQWLQLDFDFTKLAQCPITDWSIFFPLNMIKDIYEVHFTQMEGDKMKDDIISPLVKLYEFLASYAHLYKFEIEDEIIQKINETSRLNQHNTSPFNLKEKLRKKKERLNLEIGQQNLDEMDDESEEDAKQNHQLQLYQKFHQADLIKFYEKYVLAIAFKDPSLEVKIFNYLQSTSHPKSVINEVRNVYENLKYFYLKIWNNAQSRFFMIS
jgi:hypothetical protein